MFVYVSRDLRPATCDLRLIACRKSQVVVRFDVARLIARPVAGSHSSRPKKQRLKIKKILIARLVASRRSQVARHSQVAGLVAGRKSQIVRYVNERNLSRKSQVAGRATRKRTWPS
ncbi:hypothetical protein YC2023_079812 [Brassica napus]